MSFKIFDQIFHRTLKNSFKRGLIGKNYLKIYYKLKYLEKSDSTEAFLKNFQSSTYENYHSISFETFFSRNTGLI